MPIVSTWTVILLGLLAGTEVSRSDVADPWMWRNPVPTGSHLYSVAYGDGMFVAVGAAGAILTSTNGSVWSPQRVPMDTWLSQVIYAQGAFVAVGNVGPPTNSRGFILSSTNGTDWVCLSTNIGYAFHGIAFTQGNYFVTGSVLSDFALYDVVRSSARLGDWSEARVSAAQPLNQVAYGNGMYLAVGGGSPAGINNPGNTGAVLVSTNGADWSDVSSGQQLSLGAVAFGNGVFVTVSSLGDLWTTADGVHWQDQTATVAWTGVSFLDHQFLAVGGDLFSGLGVAWSSVDGTNWTALDTSAAYTTLNSVAAGSGQYVAVGLNGEILVSNDTTAWTEVTVNPLPDSLWAVTFGMGKFVTVGTTRGGLNSLVGVSTDGIAWQRINVGINDVLTDVIYASNRFLAVGMNGTVLWSDDGTTWQASSAPLPSPGRLAPTTAAYGDGLYLLCSPDGTIFSSVDLTNWTKAFQATNFNFVSAHITYANGRFVVGAPPGGTVLISTNGRDWVVGNASSYVTDIAVVTNQLVTVNGHSTNGLDWSFHSLEFDPPGPYLPNNNLDNLAYGDGVFAAVDSYSAHDSCCHGSVWTSTNGVVWTRRFVSPFSLYGIAYGNGVFVAVGDTSTVIQSPYVLPIRLSGSLTNNGFFNLTITSPSGWNLAVDASSDLQTWQFLTNLVNTTGTTNLFEPIPSDKTPQYYRARRTN